MAYTYFNTNIISWNFYIKQIHIHKKPASET